MLHGANADSDMPDGLFLSYFEVLLGQSSVLRDQVVLSMKVR